MGNASDEPLDVSSSVDILSLASAGKPPAIERMPRPTLAVTVAMRDGITLDTQIWLPFDRPGPFPAILLRTPYQEPLMGWLRLDPLRYRAAGYAVIFQVIRGIGASGGSFAFNNPLDRTDGYDSVEWIAAQPWCTGAVGMDGSSYGAMTQLSAAIAQPPHLRCIVPAVISADFFRHVPRFGGAFSRQHALGWTQFTATDSLADLTPGLWGNAAFLASPPAWRRLLSRPAADAAAGVLSEDRLQHYQDILAHETLDDWWRQRTLGPADFARVACPVLVVTGVFDGTMGSQHIWQMLERHAPAGVERRLLIGPWDHGEAYVGGSGRKGPYRYDPGFDLAGVRIAFFDRHLKGEGPGPDLPGRASYHIMGSNLWIGAPAYPHPDVRPLPLWLVSDGLANLRGHGSLSEAPPPAGQLPDSFRADPSLPFVPVGANLDPSLVLDLRETERQEDVLVYTSAPLVAPLTLLGEFDAILHVSADTPDCDIVCQLAAVPPDGRTTLISDGLLRMRYHHGFDREVWLEPGVPVEARIAMRHLSHCLPPGHRLRLLIGASAFPLIDPNPNTGAPTGTAIAERIACQSIHHDTLRPSRIELPRLLTDPAEVATAVFTPEGA